MKFKESLTRGCLNARCVVNAVRGDHIDVLIEPIELPSAVSLRSFKEKTGSQ
jgi:hypothetical protein